MAKKPLAKEQEKFVVRLPEGMRETLKNLAAESNRSVNAQIVYMLEYAMSDLMSLAGPQDGVDAEKTPADIFRRLLRQNIAVLTQVIGDYEDPDSDINRAAREDEERVTGRTLAPTSTPVNRMRRRKPV